MILSSAKQKSASQRSLKIIIIMTTKTAPAERCALCGLAGPSHINLDSKQSRKQQLREQLKLFCGVQTVQSLASLCSGCHRKLQHIADRCEALRKLAAGTGHCQLEKAALEKKVSGVETFLDSSPSRSGVPVSHSPVGSHGEVRRRVASSPCGATPKRIKRTERLMAPEAPDGPEVMMEPPASSGLLPKKLQWNQAKM